ncbi:MAG: hypothetical protein L0Y44_01590 [Phycisphaerales bacterium]|nr:hypothetical protein [Phycisphaerales bacterium]MCI0629330.1 hypothetical protein [Phycisphaerales bacterium]
MPRKTSIPIFSLLNVVSAPRSARASYRWSVVVFLPERRTQPCALL